MVAPLVLPSQRSTAFVAHYRKAEASLLADARFHSKFSSASIPDSPCC
jgi:hypothetical protein